MGTSSWPFRTTTGTVSIGATATPTPPARSLLTSTATKRLREGGAQALSPRSERGWGDEAAYYADLEGNVVAVGRRLD